MSLPALKAATFQVLAFFWACLMVLLALGIYKYVLYDVLAGWHYQAWGLLEWVIYVVGVLVYISGFATVAAELTLWMAKKAGKKPAGAPKP